MAALITFLLWIPNPDQMVVYYILAALWGVGDAVIQTQINGKIIRQLFLFIYLQYYNGPYTLLLIYWYVFDIVSQIHIVKLFYESVYDFP